MKKDSVILSIDQIIKILATLS
jgi:hypothetical protein